MTEKKYIIECALDELDACYDQLETQPLLSDVIKKDIRGCVRKIKEILSENLYKGKLRKLKRGCA